MSERAPDRVDGLYATWFSKADGPSDPPNADRVVIDLRGYHPGLGHLIFKLPRDATNFDNAKRALMAAFELGRSAAQADLREALGIKECCHAD